jgi:hypothetical protein
MLHSSCERQHWHRLSGTGVPLALLDAVTACVQVILDGVSVDWMDADAKLPAAAQKELRW